MAQTKPEAALHANHRARMQARVERDGLESLAEHEALEYLLFFAIPRQDTNALAHRLIDRFGSFCKVLEATPNELMEVEGIGPQSARLLSSMTSFWRYYACRKRGTHRRIATAKDAMEYAKPLFYGVDHEMLYLILLDDHCRPLGELLVAEGVSDRVTVDTHKLLRDVAYSKAPRGILAHNHPFGFAVPSPRDIATTQAIAEALSRMGFVVEDHIVVAGEDACSMAARGLMPPVSSDGGILNAASR